MTTDKPYCPRGAIVPLIEAVRAEPERIFTVADAVKVMGVRSNKVGGSLTYALRAEVIFRGKVKGQTVYKGTPFAPEVKMDPPPVQKKTVKVAAGWPTSADDPRIPQVVPGWKPPSMVCVRGV
jgi:hypothetical protein